MVWSQLCLSPYGIWERGREEKMAFLILKIVAMWSLLATVTGLGLGAIIRRGERARKDEFLASAFASLEAMQASRS
jgi:hypothetical protein